MPEHPQQRDIRRAISQWLTGQINKVTNDTDWQASVRRQVLLALSGIDIGCDEIASLMQERYRTRKSLKLVDFYMKGGNAFKVSIGDGLTSGGDSDWDTQVVIDEWAPVPILGEVHALVEDLALSQLREAGIRIANVLTGAGVDLTTEIEAAWATDSQSIQGLDLSSYTLKYDEPQTLRRVFGHDIGLWFHTGTPLRDAAHPDASKWVPGMVFNDAIGPFVIYRLGYTWRAELGQNGQAGALDVPIDKPILMELIDITIPRRDTVEAVEVWDAIRSQHMQITEEPVGFGNMTVRLPFPDIYYHLREQLEMLCEIADGSSHHQSKMSKRFERLNQIYMSPKVSKDGCKDIISVQAGVQTIAALDTGGPIVIDQQIYDLIPTTGAQVALFHPASQGQYTVDPASQAYRYGVLMMMQVAETARRQPANFTNGQISQQASDAIKKARSSPVFATLQKLGAWALSDDVVYFALLDKVGYIDLPAVGLSGVAGAALCRVAPDKLQASMNTLTQNLAQGVTTKQQAYQTDRGYGYSSDWTVVYFTNNKPTAMVTLTTATEQQLAFDKSTPGLFGGQTLTTAPLAEMARQRKMAASLVQDYSVRKALTRQYEAGQQAIEVG